MGRIATADKDAVWSAAAALADAGQVPTIQAVRDRIGGGSFGSIAPLLKEWKEERETARQRPVVQLPAEALEVVQEAARSIFATAEQFSRDRIKAVESQASARVAAAETERDELFLEVGRLEGYIPILEEQYRERNEAALRLEQDNARLNGLLDGLREALGRCDLRVSELEKNLSAQIERNTELDAAYKATSAHNRELSGQVARLDALRKPASVAEVAEAAKVSKSIKAKKAAVVEPIAENVK